MPSDDQEDLPGPHEAEEMKPQRFMDKMKNRLTGQIIGHGRQGLEYRPGGVKTRSKRRSLPWVKGDQKESKEKKRRRMSKAHPECKQIPGVDFQIMISETRTIDQIREEFS